MDHDYHRSKKTLYKMYRQCKVPLCKNNTSTTPGKLFLKVPIATSVRQQWLAAAGVITNASAHAKTPDYFFCEDHFELENDIENYMAYKMGFLKRIRVKNGCMPSKFNCQNGNTNPVVNSFIKMDVLQGRNILAIETMASESDHVRSGLIINMGEKVLYESTTEKEEKCDNVEGYHEEYYKFIKPRIKANKVGDGDIVFAYENLSLVNLHALSKDHDYCKKLV